MPPSPVQAWLDKAAEDEKVTALIRAGGGPWSQAAYHIQQAAEKRLKAALVAVGVAPPHTHDLEYLLSLFPNEPTTQAVDTAAAMAGRYAWLTRYPGAPPISEPDVEEAEEHLAELRTWANDVIVRHETP